jgi:hypothetical protein
MKRSPAQIRASEANWAKFLIAGTKANLEKLELTVDPAVWREIRLAQVYLTRALNELRKV